MKEHDMFFREEDIAEIRKKLASMDKPVRIVLFTQQLAGACQFCFETEQLLKQVAGLSEKITFKTKNFITDQNDVQTFGIDKIPATAVCGERDFGIRFYGIPSGYEFASFLETLVMVSKSESGLQAELKQKIQTVTQPVRIQVFVTPTCPYCPRAAVTAVQLAMENEHVSADIVEITEFPHLAQKYSVMGVPKVVMNETHGFEGALPESLFVEHVINAVKELSKTASVTKSENPEEFKK